MATRAKTFDCVAMKDRIQARRMEEYEARRGEFASYVDFINARIAQAKQPSRGEGRTGGL